VGLELIGDVEIFALSSISSYLPFVSDRIEEAIRGGNA
jgi:hypothetical protein